MPRVCSGRLEGTLVEQPLQLAGNQSRTAFSFRGVTEPGRPAGPSLDSPSGGENRSLDRHLCTTGRPLAGYRQGVTDAAQRLPAPRSMNVYLHLD
jgi:hypothetical protein